MADRPAWISASEAETIWMSRIAMNMPKTMQMNAKVRRRSCAGGVRPAARRALRDGGRLRPSARTALAGRLGAASAAVRVSTSTTTDRPGRSRSLLRHVGGDGDADRHALHDLGEVAGRVLGRQQAEHRARGRRDALDRAGDVAIREGVDRDVHLLARPQRGELRLLEVRVDMDAVQRHERGKARAGLHDMCRPRTALLPTTPSTRRADFGERQVALGLVDGGLQFGRDALGLDLLRAEDLDIGLGGRQAPPRRS